MNEEERKYFTLHGVEGVLPKVGRLVSRLQVLQKALDILSTVEFEIDDEGYFRNLTTFNKDFHKLSFEFYKKLEEVELVGGVLTDLDLGLVDFYHKFEGRDVFLCWKVGEKKVCYWHEVDEEFHNRNGIVQ